MKATVLLGTLALLLSTLPLVPGAQAHIPCVPGTAPECDDPGICEDPILPCIIEYAAYRAIRHLRDVGHVVCHVTGC